MSKPPEAAQYAADLGAMQGAASGVDAARSPELAAAHAELATATALNKALVLSNAEQATSRTALRESEDELWHTVELSPQIPWMADQDGNVIGWSMRWLELAGLAGEEMKEGGWTQVPHPEDLPRMVEAWARSIRTGEPYNIEHRIRVANGSFRWMRSRALPRRDPEGRIMRWYGTTEDIEDRKKAEIRLLALVELGDRLRDLRDPVEIAYAAAEIIGRTLEADRAGYGVVDAAEETLRVDRDWTAEGVSSLKGVFQLSDYWSGFAQALRRGEVILTNDTRNDPRTAPLWENYAELGIRAALHAPAVLGGRVTAMLYVHAAEARDWSGEEVAFVRGVAERAWAAAERARAERQHEVILLELNHRVKNILATVQGMASSTLKGTGGDPHRFAEHFGARLRTLARAHDMLAAGSWEPAGVETTIRTALAPWLESTRAVQLAISGEARATKVSPRQAQALVLAFHELATNATKYGALSTPLGEVRITCDVGDDGGVAVRWVESGGPPVTKPPDRRGFGTRLLERGLSRDLGLGSQVALRFEPKGLEAMIQFKPDRALRWLGAAPN